ncbi:T9SS type A sorting domain-containing protein [Xanthomarina sp. F1114]|uniref:T9SS type A sorting domain-containing protein n=1 Tax=Xanthomarina sp. F1114 TaxID=2996019 RepID=UPI00225E5624|nr:T9SS type A sorting domain-containing protein [Xanthomarina sp. F1114]MCX7547668.1 T9SS type A sorting domain-containing protein [Xanthomarina sp. F1114]
MKHIITLILLAAYSFSFAQTDLHISDNANVYIYVDGTAFTSGPTVAPLYVNNGINLVGDGNLYLRNEAQLIQNNPTANNSGTGRLSVYQTGNSNVYMYNYWGSPVGQNSGAAGNTDLMPSNNFYLENTAPISSTAYGYIGGYNGTNTLIANYWLYKFTGVQAYPDDYQDWIGLGGGVSGDQNGTLEPGYGFTMKGSPSGAQQYDFRGRPNNGDITVILNRSRETLVGNPYPSAIDARDFIHNAHNQANTTGVLKYWEQRAGATSHVLSNYVGGYATYTVSSDGLTDSYVSAPFNMYNPDGTPAGGPIGTGVKTARRYIPIGQGFMMEGTATAPAQTVLFSNSQRVFYKQSGADSEFFRTSETSSNTYNESQYNEDGYNIVSEDYKRFRINVGFNNNGNESYSRQLLMNFHHTATDGFDYGLEAKISEQVASDANWVLEGVPYVIQAFNYNMELRIPLVVKIGSQQAVMFRILDVQNFDTDQPIFIHDIENGVYVNLRENNYEINLPQGTYTDRFEITFTSESLNIDQVVTADDLNIYQNNQLAQLNIANPKLLDVKQVRLYEVSGKQIFNQRNLNTEVSYSFSTKNLSQGVYIASITLADNQVVSKKIVVSNK